MTRRADRLFQIVQILRGRRLTTAALLAQRLAVSERTIYRDIRIFAICRYPVLAIFAICRYPVCLSKVKRGADTV
ncbi:Transcriptional regulator, DeoR family [Salmonella enterica subsp. enterica serovar Hvittingfoss str. A4-620]|nr:Transcriptional regulator, DeoR family [Salmonella enterica subsp. enterica serovar Hvittingfoss str. A4-620]